jgi:hypothetical protein
MSDINALLSKSTHPRDISVLQHAAGLKAMLDVLPDDTEGLSGNTIEGYLWVIELLLKNIYDGLQEQTGEDR